MAADAVVYWGTLAVLNFALAFLIGGVRPFRFPNLIASVLVGFNALLGMHVILQELLPVGLPRFWSLFWSWVQLLLNLPTLAALVLLPWFFPRRLLSPRAEKVLLLFAGVYVLGNAVVGRVRHDWIQNNPNIGTVSPYTVFLPFFILLAVGCFILLHTYLTTPSGAIRNQARFVLAVLLLKAAGYLYSIWLTVEQAGGYGSSFVPLAVAYSAPLVIPLVATPIALVSSRLRRVGVHRDRPWRHDAFVVGMPFLVLVFFLDGELATLEYMVLRPVVIAYAILRYQMLDVDIRSRRSTVAFTVLATVGAVSVVTAYHLAQYQVASGILVGVAFTVALGVAGVLLWPLLRVLLQPQPGEAEQRDRDLYRAALEQAVADDSGHRTADQRVLHALRSRLQISDREHAAMEANVRALFGGPAAEMAPGRMLLGRYTIDRLLGEGGFGRTYLAEDRQVGRRVVLKAARAADRNDARRLLREARVIGKLAHPHIVTVYDVEQVGDEVILVLEYVEGGSLEQRLRGGKLPMDEALGIFDGVLAALEAAHAHGVVHRDVKPGNILLTPDARPKLADFGVARAQVGSGTVAGLTLPGSQPGSLRYMSPEQVRGVELDARSDLYSACVVLYEMLAGRSYLAFEGRAEFDARLAILDEAPALPLRRVPAGVNELLAAGLAKDPGERPRDARTLRGLVASLRAVGAPPGGAPTGAPAPE